MPSSRIGSSTIRRGNIFSARPGTNTAAKLRPRAASIGATNTRPWTGSEDGAEASRRRDSRTRSTSFSVTGPTGLIGASSARVETTRSGLRSARAASAPRRSSQSPQAAARGRSSRSSMSGRAKPVKAPRSASERRAAAERISSSSSTRESWSRYALPSPSRRRRQRSGPPMTAASTRSFSQRRGARSCPFRTGASGSLS